MPAGFENESIPAYYKRLQLLKAFESKEDARFFGLEWITEDPDGEWKDKIRRDAERGFLNYYGVVMKNVR